MAEFASKGVGGAGLGLGIAGTALGLANGGLNNLLGKDDNRDSENPHEMYRRTYRECQDEQCEMLKKKLEKIM